MSVPPKIVIALLVFPPGCHGWLKLPPAKNAAENQLARDFLVAVFRRALPSAN